MFGTVLLHLSASPPPDRCEATVEESDARAAVIDRCDRAHVCVGVANRELFDSIHEVERTGVWADDGARDLAQWLWMRYGMSDWKARRLIETASALPHLPAITRALDHGELGVDKVVELARFAQPARTAWSRGPGRSRPHASVRR